MSDTTPTVTLYSPVARSSEWPHPLAKRLPTLKGRRIAVIDNGKPNAVPLLDRFCEVMGERVELDAPAHLHGVNSTALISWQTFVAQIDTSPRKPEVALVGVGD